MEDLPHLKSVQIIVTINFDRNFQILKHPAELLPTQEPGAFLCLLVATFSFNYREVKNLARLPTWEDEVMCGLSLRIRNQGT